MASYWLLKTEPEVYSFERLLKEKRTNWDHVRNYQARNYLRDVKMGDTTLIYHSGDAKAVVGIAECTREAYPDLDAEDDREWVQIDIAPIRALSQKIPLSEIKAVPGLKDMPLIRHTRLSVMPITKKHFEILIRLAEK
jgi:predicted RNA-binding protein with PUA-like domain